MWCLVCKQSREENVTLPHAPNIELKLAHKQVTVITLIITQTRPATRGENHKRQEQYTFHPDKPHYERTHELIHFQFTDM